MADIQPHHLLGRPNLPMSASLIGRFGSSVLGYPPALLLLMLEALTKDLVFTISLKRGTQNLQLSTSWTADYSIFWLISEVRRDLP